MDDFSIFRASYNECLNSLEAKLKRHDWWLVLNLEKYHFMFTEGIVLGHKISNTGLEVDPVKVDVVSKIAIAFWYRAIVELFETCRIL